MVDLSITKAGQALAKLPVNREGAVVGPSVTLGQELQLEVVEVMFDHRYLVKIDGLELVAEGALPLAAGKVYSVKVTSMVPDLALKLVAVEKPISNFPGLGQAVATLLAEPNAFANRLLRLSQLLAALRVPELDVLHQLTATLVDNNSEAVSGQRFNLANLFPFFGLALEAALADKINLGTLPLSSFLSSLDKNLKVELLKTSSWLLRQKPAGKMKELALLVQDSLKIIELNQVLNNSGVKQFDGLQLVLPWFNNHDDGVDCWLKIERQPTEDNAKDAGYSLVVYLDLAAFGPVYNHIVIDQRRITVTIQVVGKQQLELLAGQVSAVESDLQARLLRPVHLRLKVKPTDKIRSLWRKSFLVALPNFVNANA